MKSTCRQVGLRQLTQTRWSINIFRITVQGTLMAFSFIRHNWNPTLTIFPFYFSERIFLSFHFRYSFFHHAGKVSYAGNILYLIQFPIYLPYLHWQARNQEIRGKSWWLTKLLGGTSLNMAINFRIESQSNLLSMYRVYCLASLFVLVLMMDSMWIKFASIAWPNCLVSFLFCYEIV